MQSSFSAQIHSQSACESFVREKNTFLEVVRVNKEEGIDAGRGARRRHSAPEVLMVVDVLMAAQWEQSVSEECSSCSCKWQADDNMYSSEASTVMGSFDEERASTGTGSINLSEMMGRFDDEEEEVAMCIERKTKARARPCKGKRDRHNRFVGKLMSQMRMDLENFDVNNISWPPSLLEDDITKKKVIEKLEAHKAKIQEKLLSPDPKESLRNQNPIVLSLASLFLDRSSCAQNP